MERLTNGIDYCKIHCDFGKSNECFFSDKDKCYERSIYNRLREYEDLEEQGLLLKLPCKVGDTIYFKAYKGVIVNTMITDILIDSEKIIVCDEVANQFDINDFGKTVFLTQAEADQKLKEMGRD